MLRVSSIGSLLFAIFCGLCGCDAGLDPESRVRLESHDAVLKRCPVISIGPDWVI